MKCKLLKSTLWFVVSAVLLLTIVFAVSQKAVYADEEMQGSCENGFVEDISVDHGARNPRLYNFNPAVTEYDIIWNDTPTGTIMPFTTVSSDHIGVGDAEKLFSTYYIDGTPITIGSKKNLQYEFDSATLNPPILYNTKKYLTGAEHDLKIRVGTKAVFEEDDADNYSAYDEYVFHIKRQLSLKTGKFQVKEGTANLTLSPAYKPNDYVQDYLVISTVSSIQLVLEANTAGTDIYIGDELYDSNKEYDLSSYRSSEDEAALLPISLRKNGSNYLEGNYSLVISPEDYTPKIISQPQDQISVDKGSGQKLSVDVEQPKKGTLSYQWYVKPGIYGKGAGGILLDERYLQAYMIPGATDKAVTVDQKYACPYAYYCVVTNKVGNATFQIMTDRCVVNVNRTYPTAPRIKNLSIKMIDGDNSNTFYTGGSPILRLQIHQEDYEGLLPTIEIYRNDSNNTEGGTLVASEQLTDMNNELYLMNSEKDEILGSDGKYDISIPDQDLKGEYYYYAKVTTTENNQSDSTVSNTVKLVFKENDIVTGLDGTGTKDDPFLLRSYEDLLYIKGLVEGKDGTANNLAGVYFRMANDIELSSDWEPIGTLIDPNIVMENDIMQKEDVGRNMYPFAGVFDGGGHTLIVADQGKPLFNYVRRATIQNLNIYGEHINGYGLIDKYVVDYGPNGIYGDTPWTCNINDVCILTGTKVLKSGFLGGYASGKNNVRITNCVVEKGVTIGDDGTYGNLDDTEEMYMYVGMVNYKDIIGSFAGAFNGSISNCISYADVYGRTRVGGIIGMKGQSMGLCSVKNTAFVGNIYSTGERVGGIAGSGYEAGSAPNTPVPNINNCYVDANIKGKGKVGGIQGSEGGKVENSDEGDMYGVKGAQSINNSIFYGKLESEEDQPGGIIGYVHDFSKIYGEATNYYLDTCGASDAIGSHHPDGEITGTDKHSLPKTAEEFADGTVLELLNSSESSYKNWKQGKKYPVFTDEPVISDIEVGGDYKSEYIIGEDFDKTGLTVTAKWTNGDRTKVDTDECTFEGFDSKERGVKTIKVQYGPVSATYTVKVLYEDDGTPIHVSFKLLGDDDHGTGYAGEPHCLAGDNLKTWIDTVEMEVGINDTVWDVMQKVAAENDKVTWSNPSGNYVDAVTYDGVALAEFTNGPLTGWMYTLNEVHPLLGVSEQFLEDGDSIVFHYTDDYTLEEGSNQFGGEVMPDDLAAVKKQIAELPDAADVTSEDEQKIRAARKAYDALSSQKKEKIFSKELSKLESAEDGLIEAEKRLITEAEETLAEAKAAKQKVDKELAEAKQNLEDKDAELQKTKAEKTASDVAFKKAETDKKIAEDALKQAETKQKIADEAVKKAEADKKAAEDALAKVLAEKETSAKEQVSVLGKVKIKKAKGSKKKVTLTWKKIDGAQGYEIIIAKNKKGTRAAKTYTIKKNKTKKILKKLKKGKYFVRVRAYKNYKGNTLYGKFSKAKKVRVK